MKQWLIPKGDMGLSLPMTYGRISSNELIHVI